MPTGSEGWADTPEFSTLGPVDSISSSPVVLHPGAASLRSHKDDTKMGEDFRPRSPLRDWLRACFPDYLGVA
jgi:hypothetical protein